MLACSWRESNDYTKGLFIVVYPSSWFVWRSDSVKGTVGLSWYVSFGPQISLKLHYGMDGRPQPDVPILVDVCKIIVLYCKICLGK
jgi:hypothetical protein